MSSSRSNRSIRSSRKRSNRSSRKNSSRKISSRRGNMSSRNRKSRNRRSNRSSVRNYCYPCRLLLIQSLSNYLFLYNGSSSTSSQHFIHCYRVNASVHGSIHGDVLRGPPSGDMGHNVPFSSIFRPVDWAL